jgi:hypothetical protein
MRILKNGNSNTQNLAYTSLVRPNLDYASSCWDPYREGEINALDRVQNKAAKFAHQRNELDWKPWPRAERCLTYVLSSERTQENGHRRP